MRRLLCALAVTTFVSLAAWPQQAVMDGGSPGVRFEDPSNKGYFTIIKRQDLPVHTFVIPVRGYSKGGLFDKGCQGKLEISAERVRWQPECPTGQPFDEPTSSINTEPWSKGPVRLVVAGKKYTFFPAELGHKDDFFFMVLRGSEKLFPGAFSDFPAADAEFDRLTASLQPPKPPPVVQAAPAAPPKPAEASLSLTTEPPGVQVYLDDVFRGSSSGAGKLIIPGIAPGPHRLRLSMIGFKEVSQTLELASGDKTVAFRMEKAGPKPLSQSEVEDALEKGVPKTRLISLVNEYGVDFAITTASEQSLRSRGADDSLLFAISKNRR